MVTLTLPDDFEAKARLRTMLYNNHYYHHFPPSLAHNFYLMLNCARHQGG